MKKKITSILFAGLFPVLMLTAQVPMTVVGDMKISSAGNMSSLGPINLRASSNDNGIIVNYGNLKTKGFQIESTLVNDGMILNYGTASLASTAVASDLKVVKAIKASSGWSYISLPFDVKISEITSSTGVDLVLGDFNNYHGETMWIREYDPTLVASGVDGLVSITSENRILKAGKAYLFAAESDLYSAVIFKANTSDGFNINTIFDANKAVDLVYTTNTTVGNESRWGWNFVGSKQLSAFNLGSSNMNGFDGPIYLHKESGGFDMYPSIFDTRVLANFVGFYTQVYGSGESIVYKSSGMTTADAPAELRASSDQSENNMLNLILTNGETDDNCTFMFGDGFNEGYKVKEDYFKLFAPLTVSQIWSDKDIVFNAIPSKSTREIPLGIIIGNAKEHSIELGKTSGEFSEVTLLDKKNNTSHNLLDGGYHFQAEQGKKIEDRFYVRFNRISTGINEIPSSGVIAYAFEHNLYVKNIVSGDKISIFDISGRLINETTAKSTSVVIPLSVQGVCIIKVSGNTSHTSKIINK